MASRFRSSLQKDYCVSTNLSGLDKGSAVDVRGLDHRFQIYLETVRIFIPGISIW
jgi:hypothetical protein